MATMKGPCKGPGITRVAGFTEMTRIAEFADQKGYRWCRLSDTAGIISAIADGEKILI